MRRPDRITDRGELRKVARAILDERVSASTLAEYARIEKRLAGRHWYDYAVEHQLKNVGPIRAAWRRWAAKQVLIELAKSEDRNLTSDERASARALAGKIVEELNEPVIYLRPVTRRSSKRDGQCTLPSDWREKLLIAMPRKYQCEFLVMAITGARPEEIRRGFSVKALEGGFLEITLEGAKCSNATGGGQDWRRLIVDPRICLPKHWKVLHDNFSNFGRVATFPPTFGLGLQKAITRVALERLGYQKISAYSLRHSFASDLKRSKTNGDAISLAMGHVSRRSKQRYGRGQAGKSGESPLVYVEAAKALTGDEKIPPWISRLLEQHQDLDPEEED